MKNQLKKVAIGVDTTCLASDNSGSETNAQGAVVILRPSNTNSDIFNINVSYTVGWKVASLSLSMASIRFRAMLPLLALEHDGHDCRVFSDADGEKLAGLDLLVIVKSFSADDFALAQQAVARGVPVVLDLCDNIFISSYGASALAPSTSPAQMFLAMARLARAVVVTTEPLAHVVRSQLDTSVPVHVIPDGLETHDAMDQMRSRLALAIASQRKTLTQKIRKRFMRLVGRAQILRSAAMVPLTKRLARRAVRELHWKPWAKRAYRCFDAVRRSVRARSAQAPEVVAAAQRPANPDAKRILWFGNHGAPHARFGMLDLLEIRGPLETIASEFNVELVVVSNHRDKYERHIAPMRIPSTYVEWSPASIKKQLALASVVVVPNTLDAFSVCKSSNRTASALLAGVPVVATATAALDALSSSVVLDDFLEGLRLYLSDTARAAADVARGRELIQHTYGPSAIAAAWAGVIGAVLAQAHATSAPDAELAVALNITQDLDLALPIILRAQQTGMAVVAYCNVTLFKKSPRLVAALHANGIALVLLEEDFFQHRSFTFPSSVKMLLTASESNLRPHCFTRKLTDIANAQAVFTATLQHGFENIGLTYDDELQAVDKIDFSAQRIYLWGGLDTLHPKVRPDTRRKCVPMGCPKPAHVARAELSGLLPPGMPVIGVFENLHWARYSDAYRTFFIANVQRLANVFPEVLFLVKPHHAGVWLTSRFKGEVPKADNIVIADSQSPAWEPFTAPSLMGNLRAVISSPSTIAMDGVRQQLPVAVVAHHMTLPNYEPLPLLRANADWDVFVQGVLDPDARGALVERGRQFVRDKLLPEGADERIVGDMVAHAASGRESIR